VIGLLWLPRMGQRPHTRPCSFETLRPFRKQRVPHLGRRFCLNKGSDGHCLLRHFLENFFHQSTSFVPQIPSLGNLKPLYGLFFQPPSAFSCLCLYLLMPSLCFFTLCRGWKRLDAYLFNRPCSHPALPTNPPFQFSTFDFSTTCYNADSGLDRPLSVPLIFWGCGFTTTCSSGKVVIADVPILPRGALFEKNSYWTLLSFWKVLQEH